MLSLTCQTAIKAVVFLASKIAVEERISILKVAENIKASEHSVGKILQTLVKSNVIQSSKGPTGGFYLSPAQLKLPLMSIVQAIDGPEIFKRCGLGLSQCASTHPCPIHNDYKIVRDQFEKLCLNKKISDLCTPLNEGLSFLIG